MKRFLCPIDFSNASFNAMEYAARLARHFDAELTLLHILKIPALQEVANMSSGFNPAVAEREKATEEKLRTYGQLLAQEFSIRCNIQAQSHTSGLHHALAREIRSIGYDLVIMGTNGAENLNQFYFGTHTYKVLKRIACPLLLVPEKCSFEPLRKVVYAMDYRKEDLETVRHLLQFTKDYSPHVNLLHISKVPSALSEEIFCCFKDILEDELDNSLKIDFHRIVSEDSDDVAGEIDRYMNHHGADLLVLLTRQYGFIESIFHSSVTKELSYIASYPILVYHKENMDQG